MDQVLTPATIGSYLDAFQSDARQRLEANFYARSFAGKLEANIVAGLGTAIRDLMLQLLPMAQLYARADFRVGAVMQGESGSLYFGANLEIPKAPLGWTLHAEQSAVLNALVHGERAINRLAVTAAPCGHCRQFLTELAKSSELEILLSGRETVKLPQLLPQAFGPADLGVTSALLAHGELRVSKIAGAADPLISAGLDALRMSYSPYTHSPSAVAFDAGDDVIVAAPYVENAAYNPSLPPMIAALDRLRFRNTTAAAIRKAVLVEIENPPIEQASTSQAILKAAGSNAELTVLKIRLATE